MSLSIPNYISALSTSDTQLTFDDTLAVIDANYNFTPTAFKNGNVENAVGTNNGSCKVFSFAKLNGLTQAQTLAMFAQHYQNVLDNPNGDAHANIRAFMESGFDGVAFDGEALAAKS